MDQLTAKRIEDSLDFEASRTEYPSNMPDLPGIPAGRYVDPRLWDLEQERLWRKSWLCAGRVDELSSQGSYKLFTRVGMSIIIVRDKDDAIQAFHNICRHRGTPLVFEKTGRLSRFVCGYHAWCYDLKGKLTNVTQERDFGDLDKAANGLLSVRCELWGGWIFINCDDNARPLLEEIGPVADQLSSLGMEKLQIRAKCTYEANCNWKATQDAFLEAYHVNVVHPQTLAPMIEPNAIAMELFDGGHSRMVMRKKSRFGDGGVIYAPTPPENDISVPQVFRTNYIAYNLFPNLIAPVDSGGFPFMLFWPTSPNHVEIEFYVVGKGEDGEKAEPGNYWQAMVDSFNAVMAEDLEFVDGMHRSLASGALTRVNVGYQERRIYWLNEEIDRRIGTDTVPPELLVKPLLSHLVAPNMSSCDSLASEAGSQVSALHPC
jgi:phenylpropionate dioxygenase-like ring-hydroxylating dioxygenase large terminal subunit